MVHIESVCEFKCSDTLSASMHAAPLRLRCFPLTELQRRLLCVHRLHTSWRPCEFCDAVKRQRSKNSFEIIPVTDCQMLLLETTGKQMNWNRNTCITMLHVSSIVSIQSETMHESQLYSAYKCFYK